MPTARIDWEKDKLGVYFDPNRYQGLSKENQGKYVIDTLEGVHDVTDGDWIITGVKGESYPCKPDIFEMTYEKVK